ncbi:MAG: hypothetical protein QM718_06470 [Steroidobacteraceae bacterium]
MLSSQLSLAADTPAATVTSSVADYHPSMGDLMTMAVQPRHIKLGLAGKNGNWTYAAYELSELRNAFARIGRTIPIYNSTDTAALATSMTQAVFAELDQAVKASDAKQFATAYQHLTEVCNACHVSQGKAMVVIKAPDASMYPDQDFRE